MSLPKLPFLAALERNDFLFSEVKGALSLVTRGYITGTKGRKVVMNWVHGSRAQQTETNTQSIAIDKPKFDNPNLRHTFRAPSSSTQPESKLRRLLSALKQTPLPSLRLRTTKPRANSSTNQCHRQGDKD